MRIGRLSAVLGTLLLAAAAVPAAGAASNAHCGVGLTAGLSICIDWMMKASEYRDLIARAHKGDGDAAQTLAAFEDMRDDRTKQGGWKWWMLAAERGNCRALLYMEDEASRNGRRATAAKWRTRIRWTGCTPEKAYP